MVPFGSKVFFKSTTDRVKKQKYEDPAIVGVFAGYETTPGYGWSGIYLAWRLEESAGMDLMQNSHVIARRQLVPYVVRELEIAEEGIVYPLKAEYERVNTTLEGIGPGGYSQILEWPADVGELSVVAKPIEVGDRWFEAEYYWYRLHVNPRTRLFTPTTIENGPDLNCLKDMRATLLCSSNHGEELIRDIWRDVHLADEDLPSWTGVTVFNKVKTTELSNRAGSSSDDAHLGHVPWTGATPPIPMKLEDPGVFVRR